MADRTVDEARASSRSVAALRLARILIPVANPATASALIRLAACLGAGSPPAELVALRVITPPRGTSLRDTRQQVHSTPEPYEGALSQATASALAQGVELRTELQVARGVAAGILAFANSMPDLDLILLGWRGSARTRQARRDVSQEILRHARAHVAVLRTGLPEPIRRILVPVGWGPHARLGLRLAERLAPNTGAAVTAFRVLPATGDVDWEEERAALESLLAIEAPGLRYGTELLLTRSATAVLAIVNETRRVAYDLVIIGASEEWPLRHWLFGAMPDQIAEQAPCAVLLVRSYGTPPG
ncbi:MAG: universal stress protein [Anaerolineae bacterium]|nr:universal stress protein [Anaerolineae bacterium]